MYAVVETGGKQYRVAAGDKVKVEKLSVEPGTEVVLDKVLLVQNDNGQVTIGAPAVAGAKVIAKVEAQGKADKVYIFKYKSKANYRRRSGHRQPYTELSIVRIEA